MTDAVKRYEGTEKRIKERMAEVKERIWVAVKAGKITQEQAEERWES